MTALLDALTNRHHIDMCSRKAKLIRIAGRCQTPCKWLIHCRVEVEHFQIMPTECFFNTSSFAIHTEFETHPNWAPEWTPDRIPRTNSTRVNSGTKNWVPLVNINRLPGDKKFHRNWNHRDQKNENAPLIDLSGFAPLL